MPSPRIAIVTPAPPGSRAGNRHTAGRWARILRSLGMRVDITTGWQGGGHDAMIALHALRSRAAQLSFRRRYPDRPLVLALTGTDLYRDIRIDADAADSLDRADRLVVLQAHALDELSPAQRAKATVIHQSETARGPWQPPKRFVRFCVLGHLREEKDPFLPAFALSKTDLPRLRLAQAGRALSPDMADRAERWMATEFRYRWFGELPHARALRLLRGSHALVVSSRLEGGAHVVSEAIVHGVPVIASDIPGNRGLLGDDYPACYPTGDAEALAALMRRGATEAGFLERLHRAVLARRALFEPALEAAAWRNLLAELHLCSPSRASSSTRTGAKLRR